MSNRASFDVSQISQHESELRMQEDRCEAKLDEERKNLQEALLELRQCNTQADEMRTRKVLLCTQDIMVWITPPDTNSHVFLLKCTV